MKPLTSANTSVPGSIATCGPGASASARTATRGRYGCSARAVSVPLVTTMTRDYGAAGATRRPPAVRGYAPARAEPVRAARRADGAPPARGRAGPGRLRRVVLPLARGRTGLDRGADGGERQGRPERRLPGHRDRRRAARRRLHHAQGFGIRYRVPPDTALSAFTLWRTSRCRCSGTSRRSATPTCSRPRRPSSAAGTPAAAAAASATAASPPRAGSRVPRPTRAGSCSTSTATPGMLAGQRPHDAAPARARLSDRFDPTLVGAPSGDLLEPGRALAGVRSVAFSATDRGGGVVHRDARGGRRGRGHPGRRRQRRPLPRAVHHAGAVPAHRVRLDRARHRRPRRRRPSRAARGRRRHADEHRRLRAGGDHHPQPVAGLRPGGHARDDAGHAALPRDAQPPSDPAPRRRRRGSRGRSPAPPPGRRSSWSPARSARARASASPRGR